MKKLLQVAVAVLLCAVALPWVRRAGAVEIPLDTLTPVRIGYVDLQRVFDTYPEKSFAEGDLLKEIERRKRDLGRRQTEINTFRQQIANDDDALARARAGERITVPTNLIPEPEPAAPVATTTSTGTVKPSTAAVKVDPYPTEDPLAGLPGHPGGAAPNTAGGLKLPGTEQPQKKRSILDELALSSAPVTLTTDATAALQDRLDKNRRRLDRAIADFKMFRTNAIADMKQLQTQKTYGVMAKIYAILQNVARDEGITVVMDKAYVLYGEDTVDLSDKLISRLGQEGL